MGNRGIRPGLSFTANAKGTVRSLITSVEIESSANEGHKIKINALWDTGATCSLVRPELAVALNLKPISKTLMDTPSDKGVPSNIYLINVYLPNGARIMNIRSLEGTPNNCDMIIGMDVITMGDFAITNYDGNTKFSFRIPSMTEIDFCKHSYLQPNKNELQKVGRNNICPCGSGKKYKFCCINKESPRQASGY